MFKQLKLKRIYKFTRKLLKDEGLAIDDTLFDSFVNSFKQSIIKEIKFVPQKTKMIILKQQLSRFEKLRKFISLRPELQLNQDGTVMAKSVTKTNNSTVIIDDSDESSYES